MREPAERVGPQEGASAPSLFSKWKVTLAAVCLFLGWLGWEDLRVAWRNPEPQRILPASPGPVRDWLVLEGSLDLAEAINTSGTLQIEALLVPVVEASGEGQPIRFLLETRDPERLELFRQLHLGQESEAAKAAFRQAQAPRLMPRVTVTGLRMEGFAARANASRLKKLALESGLALAPDAALLVEGRTPSPKRGFFFLTMALAGWFLPYWTVGAAKGSKALRAREKN